MITLMKVISFPFVMFAVLCVLVIYGSDEAERVADSYDEFFHGL